MIPRTPLVYAGAALCYALVARLGLLLALPQTNASLLWPAAGVGLAIILCLGVPGAGALWVGAFTANLSNYLVPAPGPHVPVPLGPQALVGAGVIACGNVAEALFCGLLLCVGRQVSIRRVLAVSPLCCLLAAAAGPLVQLRLGLLPPSLLVSSMVVWLVGDISGQLLVTPLVIAVVRMRWPAAGGVELGEGAQRVLRWALTLGGGSLVTYVSTAYHLQQAIMNPLLPYFIGALIFLPPWEAGASFVIVTSYTTALQIRAPGATLAEIVGRLGVVGLIFGLIVYIKKRLAEHNTERMELLAERGTQRLQAILNAAPEPMLVVGPDGVVLLANDELRAISGYGRGELVGCSVDILVPGRTAPRHAVLRAGYMKEPTMRAMGRGRELELRRKDGSLVPVEISLSPYQDGEQTVVVAAVVDISVRREAEAERLNQVQATEEAEERALAAERRAHERSAFMSAAAHELRTPLTALRAYVEMVQGIMDATEQLSKAGEPRESPAYQQQRARAERAVPALMRQVMRLEHLVNLLLDVTRLEQDRVQLERKETDIAALVREVCATTQLVDPDHPLKTESPPTLWGSVDPERLGQVLDNILANAREYSPRGSTIGVSMHKENSWVIIRVRDHGVGIPPEEHERVWERFYQVGRTERSQGLGIGLFVVRAICAMHGGSAAVVPNDPPGEGTTIEVRLPLGSGKDPPAT